MPDIAGPRVYPMGDMLRGYLRARGKHRPLIPVRQPGKAARAFRAGANLAPDHAVGRRTWEEFLAGSGNGGGGIRTRGPRERTPVFKTGAFDRSATPPGRRPS